MTLPLQPGDAGLEGAGEDVEEEDKMGIEETEELRGLLA